VSTTCKLERLPDWQSRLSAFVVANSARRFEYGAFDCGLFVAGAIEAMTGVDVAGELRGKYRRRGEAFRAIADLCGRPTMAAAAEFFAARWGCCEIPVGLAQRGDAVQLKRNRAAALGIVAMHGTEILTPYRDGLLRLPLEHATRAWRI
jgi:hypothetical protein